MNFRTDLRALRVGQVWIEDESVRFDYPVPSPLRDLLDNSITAQLESTRNKLQEKFAESTQRLDKLWLLLDNLESDALMQGGESADFSGGGYFCQCKSFSCAPENDFLDVSSPSIQGDFSPVDGRTTSAQLELYLSVLASIVRECQIVRKLDVAVMHVRRALLEVNARGWQGYAVQGVASREREFFLTHGAHPPKNTGQRVESRFPERVFTPSNAAN